MKYAYNIGGSLVKKIALSIFLAFIITAVATVKFVLSFTEHEATLHFSQSCFSLVSSIADDADAKLRMAHGVVIATAAQTNGGSVNSFEAAEIFLNGQTALRFLFDNGLFIISQTGHLLAENPQRPDRKGKDVSEREFFKTTIETRGPYISRPYISTHQPGLPAVIMTAPIFDRAGNLRSLLYGSMNLLGKNVLADLGHIKVGHTGYLFIADGQRSIVVHPDKARIMQSASALELGTAFDKAVEGWEGAEVTVTPDGTKVIFAAAHLKTTGWVVGAILPYAEIDESVQSERIYLLPTILVGAAIILPLGWLLINRLTRGLSQVTRQVQSMAENPGVSMRLATTATDEVGILSNAFNGLLDRLALLHGELEERVQQRTSDLEVALSSLRQAQDELVRSEKLAGLGTLVAGIAHEVNTPIGAMVAVASTLEQKAIAFTDSAVKGELRRSSLDSFLNDLSEATGMIQRNLRQASTLISNFKQVAIDQTSERRRSFDCQTVTNEVTSTLRPTVRHQGIAIKSQIPSGITLDSYPGAFGQVLTNLITNAFLHAFEGRETGVLCLTVEIEDDHIMLTVSDDGNGIPADILPRIFDPFFTTKLGSGGSGLGLHLVYAIVTRILGGGISVKSQLGIGTTFTLSIPLVAPHKNLGE